MYMDGYTLYLFIFILIEMVVSTHLDLTQMSPNALTCMVLDQENLIHVVHLHAKSKVLLCQKPFLFVHVHCIL